MRRSASATTGELRTIRRQRSFAEAMNLAHPVPNGWQDRLTPATNVCRCEEVTAGEICASRDTLAGADQRTQKGTTRAGVGWCQGRVCGFAVSALATGGEADQASLANAAKRPIAQPLNRSGSRRARRARRVSTSPHLLGLSLTEYFRIRLLRPVDELSLHGMLDRAAPQC